MVSGVTNLPASVVEWDLPLAQGLQYQAIWLEQQGNITTRDAGGIDTGSKWKEIAGHE